MSSHVCEILDCEQYNSWGWHQFKNGQEHIKCLFSCGTDFNPIKVVDFSAHLMMNWTQQSTQQRCKDPPTSDVSRRRVSIGHWWVCLIAASSVWKFKAASCSKRRWSVCSTYGRALCLCVELAMWSVTSESFFELRCYLGDLIKINTPRASKVMYWILLK